MRHPTRLPTRTACAARLVRGAVAIVACALAAAAGAQSPALGSTGGAASAVPAATGAGPEDAIRFMVERAVGPDQRVEIQFGQLDPRLQLAPCGRIEPFLPPAVRFWGRTSIGLRCVEGAGWSVLMPMTVRVFGQALVAVAPLSTGASPSLADFRVEEVDLTREPAPVVADPAELDGKVLTRPVAAGQPLRRDAMRAPPTITQGDPVRILVIGQGFTIAGDGISLGAASEGQKLRARTESGRVVTGELRGRTVELKL